jgi:hypothetical protein
MHPHPLEHGETMHAPMHMLMDILVTEMEQRLLFPCWKAFGRNVLLRTVFLAAFRGTIQMITSDTLGSHSFIRSFVRSFIHSFIQMSM